MGVPNHADENCPLVSNALAARVEENEWIARFQSLIYKDFVDFCYAESGVNDAVSLKKLQDVLAQMRLIAQCPDLQTKAICALGGGFSSGKSAFANSFLTLGEVYLAEDMNPTTAIPSYVVTKEQSSIVGVNWKGATFPIDSGTYRSITHELLKSFKFNLNEIIIHILVQSPMNEDYFKNICLIDTPGYNPGGAGASGNDFSAAQKYIKDADFLIWLVRIDNGTIPQSDLDFLTDEGMEFGKTKPLYIIASRADLEPQSQIEEILDAFTMVLEDNYIEYEGISAYSAHNKKLYSSRKKDIYEFLTEHDKPKMKYQELFDMITQVFSEYFKYVNKNYGERKRNHSAVSKVLCDAMEDGCIGVDGSDRLEEGLNEIKRIFKQNQTLEERQNTVLGIKSKFIECLDAFFHAMSIECTRMTYCPKCGTVMTEGKCPRCKGKGLPPWARVKCPKCGRTLKATAQFCTRCGTRIGG